MKRVYSSDNPLIIGHLKQVLEANHIECVTRNEYLLGAAGELPPNECWPELWVIDDALQPKARALVESVLAMDDRPRADWRCPTCHEALEGQFTACWACGAERPPGA